LIWQQDLQFAAVDVLSFGYISTLTMISSHFFFFFVDLVFLIPSTCFCFGVAGVRAMNVLWDLEAFEPLDSIGYFFPRVFVLVFIYI
jgi:hypothetical protein